MKAPFVVVCAVFFAAVLSPLCGQDTGVAANSDTPQRSGQSAMLVVTLGLEADELDRPSFRSVAKAVAAYHDAPLIELARGDVSGIVEALARVVPRWMIVVVPPDVLDADLHRRVLDATRWVDADPFVDVEFGYLTARDADTLTRLWERTVAVHEQGLQSTRWNDVLVASGMKSTIYPGFIPSIARAAGFTGAGIALGIVESDPDVLEFAARELPRIDGSAVVSFSGNGDPMGIWLFDDQRNLDSSCHWEYEPRLVGQDPGGHMSRLFAKDLRVRSLQRAIIWSGTCHSAVTRRAVVEGDIVSTFGRTTGRVVHDLAADESLCLALIDAGAIALLAPIGANHGFSVEREQEFALEHGSTLGAALCSTWDDVVASAGGAPRLADPNRLGEASAEAVMAGGGANRILIGDPSLAPFPVTPHALELTRWMIEGNVVTVDVEWLAGFHPKAWDMYGNDPSRDWRATARVELVTGIDVITIASSAVTTTDGAGLPLPYSLGPCLVEHDRDRTILHLCACAPRGDVEGRDVRAHFVVTLKR